MKPDDNSNGNGNGARAFQTLQTILLAALLGGMGWVCKTTIDNREELVRVGAKADSRNSIVDAMQVTQGEMIKTLSVLHDRDADLDYRIRTLEKVK